MDLIEVNELKIGDRYEMKSSKLKRTILSTNRIDHLIFCHKTLTVSRVGKYPTDVASYWCHTEKLKDRANKSQINLIKRFIKRTHKQGCACYVCIE